MAEDGMEADCRQGFTDEMMNILETLGLLKHLSEFERNQVGPKDVLLLTTEEFEDLGIQTIGDRARLKQKCRDYLKGNSLVSPTLLKYNELTKKASKHSATARLGKLTRRLYIGWKHMYRSGVFSLVHPSRGGGQQIKDVDKYCTILELKQIMLEMYLPQGKSEAGNLSVEELDIEVVNYSGNRLPQIIMDKEFTVGLYVDSRKSNPVRIYLQTKKKSTDTETPSGPSETPSSQPETPNSQPETPSSQPEIPSSQSETPSNQPETPSSQSETPSNPSEMEIGDDNDFEEVQFVKLGTPTVTMRINRNKLKLPKKTTESWRDSTSEHLPDIPQPEGIVFSGSSHELQAARYDNTTVNDLVENDIFVDDTDSDPEYKAAIQASLEPKPTFEGALSNWKKCNIQDSEPVFILTNRNDLLHSLQRSVTKPSFSWLKPVKINFSGEIGDDLGGPKREFFNLLMKEIRKRIGEKGSLQHNLVKLEGNEYYCAGRYIVWSILHGGEACKFLSPKTVDLLLDNEIDFEIDDVSDGHSKAFILQLSEAQLDMQIPSDWLIDLGISPPFTVGNKQKLTHLALKQLQYYRIYAELHQLQKGLQSFGFLNAVKEYREGVLSLLCFSTEKLTLPRFKDMIKYNFSPVGSNQRREEEKSAYSLEVFIEDSCDGECEVTGSDILAFWTGSSDIPPLGFEKKLEVSFIDGIERLPVAHTCDMSLEIPLGSTPEGFNKKMTMAVQWGGQFHLV